MVSLREKADGEAVGSVGVIFDIFIILKDIAGIVIADISPAPDLFNGSVYQYAVAL